MWTGWIANSCIEVFSLELLEEVVGYVVLFRLNKKLIAIVKKGTSEVDKYGGEKA